MNLQTEELYLCWTLCGAFVMRMDVLFQQMNHSCTSNIQEGRTYSEASPDLCWIFDSGHFNRQIESLKIFLLSLSRTLQYSDCVGLSHKYRSPILPIEYNRSSCTVL